MMFGSRKEVLKRSALWLAKLCGGFALARIATRRRLRILCFHGIWLGEGHYSNYLFMSQAKFRTRLEFLKRANFPVISLEEAVRGLASDTLPDCATVITIDDGWYGTYRHMVPELVARKIPATIYVTSYYAAKQFPVFDVAVQYVLSRAGSRVLELSQVSGGLEGRYQLKDAQQQQAAGEALIGHAAGLNGAESFEVLKAVATLLEFDLSELLASRVFHLMSAEEIKRASEQGVDVQLHTHRHRLVTDHVSALATEIEENRAFLSPLVNVPLRHFCYPSGNWNASAWPILNQLGVASATTTAQGLASTRAPHLALPRISDGELVPAIEFEAEMCGFAELVRRARRALKDGRGAR